MSPSRPQLGPGGRSQRPPIPWKRIYQLALWLFAAARAMLDRLEAHERRELGDLLAKSRGRAANLSSHEQRRVRAIVMKALQLRR